VQRQTGEFSSFTRKVTVLEVVLQNHQVFSRFQDMGCNNSKIDSDEAVARCKARKRFMKQAVDSRLAFAASHAHYVIALKAMGAAFRQFAEGETLLFRHLLFLSLPLLPLCLRISSLPPCLLPHHHHHYLLHHHVLSFLG
jgi:hypothetical protein